jgi:CrcB protein
LTTFSTVQLELLRMLDGGHVGLAFAYAREHRDRVPGGVGRDESGQAGEVAGVSFGIVVAIGAVGGVGAIARFALDGTVAGRIGGGFPFGTFVVNVLGAFVLGVLFGAAVSQNTYRVVGTGLVGAFTTFSTWALESHRLGEDGERSFRVLNFTISLIIGVGVTWAGQHLGGWL